MSRKILVTGATGTIGKALIKSLQTKNAAFVVGVRDKEQAMEKLPNVQAKDMIEFDFSNASTYEKAIEGVDKVFILGPPLVVTLVDLLSPFIDFLKTKNIMRVVYVSALGSDILKDMPFHTILSQKLKDDGFNYTILKPSFFAQNFKNYEWENITQRNMTYMPAGNGRVGFVDVNDVGEVAAVVLTTDGHERKTYELTGPETLSYVDAARILSEVTGKAIAYPNPSPEEFTSVLKSSGAPDFIAPYMIQVYSMIADNHVNLVTSDIEKVTGKKPNSLKQVLESSFLSN
jgi:uncharacterized protein YbjT (DUF2867 family)